MNLRLESKGVQTDVHIQHTHPKLLKKLQTYIVAVSRYRLYLFNQYNQSDESHKNPNLVNVRRQILNRFDWVITELEILIENLQTYQLSVADVQQSIDRPLIKEVIETAMNSNLPSTDTRNQFRLNTDEWGMYKHGLYETKEDLYVLNIFIQRFISKIDRRINMINLYR